tara:strand:+ start:776 stop:937 length:162 start_codon:yes stop_codon:yes gene_type:complete
MAMARKVQEIEDAKPTMTPEERAAHKKMSSKQELMVHETDCNIKSSEELDESF